MKPPFDPTFPGLQIYWREDNEMEFISTTCLAGKSNYTAAQYPQKGEVLHYQYEINTHKQNQTLKIIYEKVPKIPGHDSKWDIIPGTLTISFKTAIDARPESVYWHPKHGQSSRLGEGYYWIYVSPKDIVIPSITIRRKLTFSRDDRADQQALRNKLITTYSKCMLTGTKTPSALEACHIIPVKNGGVDCIGNALLLRRDLHALFDAGLLKLRVERGGCRVKIDSSIIDSEYRALNGHTLNWLALEYQRPYLEARIKLEKK
jgi:hypothetical protein